MPESPWENGYVAAFSGRRRDELLDGALFDTVLAAKVLVMRRRRYCNAVLLHSLLGYR